MSAYLALISSSWYSSTGICQTNSSIQEPILPSSQAKGGELVNNPALSFPKAMTTAPVSVDSSTKVLTLQFYCTQCMQSAKTNLPSASVFPISTVSPFRDLMMSCGRQLLLLIKFYTTPNTATILDFTCSLAALSKALNTEHAPCLSICIPFMLPLDLRFNPPASKHTPLPTRLTKSSLSAPPLSSKQMKTGSLLLARPTACSKLNPSLSSSFPLITLILTCGWAATILSACLSRNSVLASSPRLLAHSAACVFAWTSSNMQSFSGISPTFIFILFQSFSLRENLQPFDNTSEANPTKLLPLLIESEKSTDVSLLIQPSFFQLCYEQKLVVISRISVPSPYNSTLLTLFFYKNLDNL